MLATGTHHVRSGALHWHHTFRQKKSLSYFPLKKETNQLKRANGKDDEDTGIVLQWSGDHLLLEALIVGEDIPSVDAVQLTFVPFAAVIPSTFLTATLSNPLLMWRSQTYSSSVRLTHNLTESRDQSAFAPSSSSPLSLCNWWSNTLEMTRIKWQQKPYIQSYSTSTNIMKNELVYFSFLYKMRGVLRQPGVYFPSSKIWGSDIYAGC